MTPERCAARVLASLSTDTRHRFAADPRTALTSMGLTVQAVEQLGESRQAGGVCDGMSFLRDGIILYAPTPNSRRENFTLGHELGHYQVDRDNEIMSWLADQPDPTTQLETICDRVAQRLLLPEERVTAIIQGRTIYAKTVLDLYNATQASRPACAIAIASRLPGLGAVAILDPHTKEVTFSSVQPDPDRGWPTVFPWTGHEIPAGHPLKTLGGGSRMTQRTYWENQFGAHERFYIDAINDGRRIIAVYSEHDIWECEKLHLEPQRDYLDRPTREVTCCGTTRQVRGYPCATCDDGYCPSCRRCRCQRSADREKPCRSCYMTYQPHLLVDGRCEDCR